MNISSIQLNEVMLKVFRCCEINFFQTNDLNGLRKLLVLNFRINSKQYVEKQKKLDLYCVLAVMSDVGIRQYISKFIVQKSQLMFPTLSTELKQR